MLTAKIKSKQKDSDESVTLLVDFFDDGVQIGITQQVRVNLNASAADVQKQIEVFGQKLGSAKKTEQAVDALIGQTVQIPDKVAVSATVVPAGSPKV